MARIVIKKVIYSGDKYYYESPVLEDGLNILEGENGTGKTTFSEMIYYGLGGAAELFRKNTDNKHREIMSDTNNFIELNTQIGNQNYVLTRYINSSDIGIKDSDGKITLFPVNRQADKKDIFSDWILGQLGIEPITLSLGTISWKINFDDLMRLIYLDQTTDPSYVYKAPTNDNFVTDSKVIRKAIFEILVGKTFQEYYSSLGRFRAIERQLEQANGALSLFIQTINEIQAGQEDLNIVFLNEKLDEEKERLQKLKQYRKNLSESAITPNPNNSQIDKLKNDMLSSELRRTELVEINNDLLTELVKLQKIKHDMIFEVTQIKKMMFAHETLNLFSPDTCPYCLNEVKREAGKCVCGEKINEEEYEKFFYSAKEYLDILKAKQKNVDTINDALASCNSEITRGSKELDQTNSHLSSLRENFNELINEYDSKINLSEFNAADEEIINIKSQIHVLEQQLALESKREDLEKKTASLQSEYKSLQRETNILYEQASKDIDIKVQAFSQKYYDLLKSTIQNFRNVVIKDDYMPVINNGDHLEASAVVPKRLMYVFTLLYLSLIDDSVRFPRFLLIDTPDTLGIDDKNLARSISKINDIVPNETSWNQFQIILTTGRSLYPEEFADKVFTTLTETDRLLKLRKKD